MGDGPLKPEGNPVLRHTRPELTAGWSATQQLEKRYQTRGFGQLSITERANLAQGRFYGGSSRKAENPHAFYIAKNTFGLDSITLLKVSQTLGNNSNTT